MTIDPKEIAAAATPEPIDHEEIDRVFQAAHDDLDGLVGQLFTGIMDEAALQARMLEIARAKVLIERQYEFARGAAQEAAWFIDKIACDDEGGKFFQKRLADWQAKVAELSTSSAVCDGRAAEVREQLLRVQHPTRYEVSVKS